MTHHEAISSHPVELIKQINKLRLENKNQWFHVLATVAGRPTVSFKIYGTWIQIARWTNSEGRTINSPNCGDRSVTQFKADLMAILNNAA
tara:strand:+ start:969 stop:1238 length:270 start_codon:yes stop_codon:yes gene_type:complete